VVARIQSLVESAELKVGDRLPPERELATRLGISRAALREAVKVLEARSALVVRHGRGVFVGDDIADALRRSLIDRQVALGDLYAMREVLEAPAAAWAATSATEAEIAGLAEALTMLGDAAVQRLDIDRLEKLDAAFHLSIVRAAKNQFLLRTEGVLQEMLRMAMETTLAIPGRLAISDKEHRAMVRAIKERDPDRARMAAVAHVDGARRAALARVRAEQEHLDRTTAINKGEGVRPPLFEAPAGGVRLERHDGSSYRRTDGQR
jgi:GntR family transcriptional repressor for pyruvate dehydrogenase complex